MTARLTFQAVRQRYAVNRAHGFPPLQFRESGPAYHYTCAVRLADAITRVIPDFFASASVETWPDNHPTGRYVASEHPRVALKFESAPVGRQLPIRAGELAAVLARKLGPGRCVSSPSEIEGAQGIIFFDRIEGYAGSGHISMWDRREVVDGNNYFGRCRRVVFWRL